MAQRSRLPSPKATRQPRKTSERRCLSPSSIHERSSSSPSHSSSAAPSLPSRFPAASIRRCEFPRIVVVAQSGTLPPQSMSLIVTRPLEQVVMAVPGIRRVRSRTYSRRDRDLRAVRRRHRHGRGAADGAEPRCRDHRRPAGRNRPQDRAHHAGRSSRCSSSA